MLKYIVTECHVYDKQTNYKPFDFKKEEPLFAVQRSLLPGGPIVSGAGCAACEAAAVREEAWCSCTCWHLSSCPAPPFPLSFRCKWELSR